MLFLVKTMMGPCCYSHLKREETVVERSSDLPGSYCQSSHLPSHDFLMVDLGHSELSSLCHQDRPGHDMGVNTSKSQRPAVAQASLVHMRCLSQVGGPHRSPPGDFLCKDFNMVGTEVADLFAGSRPFCPT